MGINTIESMMAQRAAQPEGGRQTPYERLLEKVGRTLYERATSEMQHERDYVLRFSDAHGHTADVTIPKEELEAIDRDLWMDIESPLEEQRVTLQITEALQKKGFELNDPTSPDITVELADTAAPA